MLQHSPKLSARARELSGNEPILKKTIRKIVRKLTRENRKPRPARPNANHYRRRSSAATASKAKSDVTGQTVYRDVPLRFRSLTVNEADFPALEGPSVDRRRVQDQGRQAHHCAPRRPYRPSEVRGTRLCNTRLPRGLGYSPSSHTTRVRSLARSDSVLTPPTGLSADELYRAEIDRLRAAGCRVCEFTRLAVDRTAASKSVLAGLFHTAYLYASKICGYTHAVIEVNPRHVVFYAKELKFDQIGPERLNSQVNAPAVLLCAPFATIAAGLAKYAGAHPPPGTKRTLFHYGFTPKEEDGVLMRLYDLVTRVESSPKDNGVLPR